MFGGIWPPGSWRISWLGRKLLCHQRGLDAVKQAFEPADQLRLGDAELRLTRDLVIVEGQRKRVQLLLEVG